MLFVKMTPPNQANALCKHGYLLAFYCTAAMWEFCCLFVYLCQTCCQRGQRGERQTQLEEPGREGGGEKEGDGEKEGGGEKEGDGEKKGGGDPLVLCTA